MEKTIEGYLRLREADERQANSRRKILTNTILHAKIFIPLKISWKNKNDWDLMESKLLNLFRSEDMTNQISTDQNSGLMKMI